MRALMIVLILTMFENAASHIVLRTITTFVTYHW